MIIILGFNRFNKIQQFDWFIEGHQCQFCMISNVKLQSFVSSVLGEFIIREICFSGVNLRKTRDQNCKAPLLLCQTCSKAEILSVRLGAQSARLWF